MKVPYAMDEDVLIAAIAHHYALDISRISFIPIGDEAYSYTVHCADGQRYFLKLFDRSNEKQAKSAQLLDFYLPLTWHIYHNGIFENVTYPIKTVHGEYQTTLNHNRLALVLFTFIEGETLADAYPLSQQITERIAGALAVIHYKVTPLVENFPVKREDFDISFIPALVRSLYVLESAAFNHRHKAALQKLVTPRQPEILGLLDLLKELGSSAASNSQEMVLCHGDVWGGNLILDRSGELIFLDWSACGIAPPERDLFGFIEDEMFFTNYKYYAAASAVTIDTSLLRFYSYRHHLRNLTNWITNILYRNTDDAQNENDLEMIDCHCMRRWERIERNVASIEKTLAR